MTYLKMLREWEALDASNLLAIEPMGLGRYRVTVEVVAFEGEDGKYVGYTLVSRWGKGREKACQRCYDEAVKRGIIEPPAEHHDLAEAGGAGQLITRA